MDFNQNRTKFIKISDCQGTCKTPIGCTCRVPAEEAENVAADAPKMAVVAVQQNEVKKESLIAVQQPPKKSCCGGSGGGCRCKSSQTGRNKLEVYDWLNDIPEAHGKESQMVEVQFKNTRKGYYLNSNNLELYKGDIVAVEATPGHDIGEVTLTGKLVQLQMKKNNFRGEIKRVYRHAKTGDIEKAEEARAKEHKTMLRAREIAENLRLDMKISDVEYQGDGNKAIFYYIADGRVDFRQLIKEYASEFRIKIEMKQIGARQEAGRVGGIGPCGRELCCSSSISSFVSVSTSAARMQEIPLNPQKLAGQCGKLKCCLNYEVDTYLEAQRKLPSRDVVLETKDNTYYHFKTDVLSGMMTFSTNKHFAANLVTIHKDRVFEIMKLNRNGKKTLHLVDDNDFEANKPVTHDVLAQENINRFDTDKKNSKRKKKKPAQRNGDSNNNTSSNQDNNTNEVAAKANNNGRENGNNRGDRNNNRERENRERPIQPRPRPEGQPIKSEDGGEGQESKPRSNNHNRSRRKNRNNRPPQNGGERTDNKPDA